MIGVRLAPQRLHLWGRARVIERPLQGTQRGLQPLAHVADGAPGMVPAVIEAAIHPAKAAAGERQAAVDVQIFAKMDETLVKQLDGQGPMPAQHHIAGAEGKTQHKIGQGHAGWWANDVAHRVAAALQVIPVVVGNPYLRVAFQKGNMLRQLVGRKQVVGIEQGDHLAACSAQAGVARRRQHAVVFVPDIAQPRIGKRLHDAGCVVG